MKEPLSESSAEASKTVDEEELKKLAKMLKDRYTDDDIMSPFDSSGSDF